MLKVLLAIFSTLSFGYSLQQPKLLLEAWQNCQSNFTSQCLEVRDLMVQLHANVEILQNNPQQMGMDIMNIQSEMENNPDNQLKKSLAEKLAIVGWLESPQ